MEESSLVRSRGPSRWMLVLWLLAGVAIMSFLRGPDVSRTQEARVLEGAREMLGSGAGGWMIPHLNGHVRIEKPPLAYWLAAGLFKLRGVGPAAGRLPFAVLGWLTIGLVYHIARGLFSRVAGVAAGAALLGSFFFFRLSRLAETDGPATLFVTAAVWWYWKGLGKKGEPRPSVVYFHLSAIALALGGLTKQGVVIYPLVFMVAWAAIEKRWDGLLRWLLSGALVTFLLVLAPWYLYAGHLLGWKVFARELNDVATGRDHSQHFWAYSYLLVEAVAPWAGITVLAVISAVRRWKSDERLRFLLVWCGSILLPLCLAGNKQSHYLMPMLPVLAVLSGWMMEQALRRERERKREEPREGEDRALRAIVGITLAAALLGAGAVFFIGSRHRGAVALEDVILSGSLLLAAVWGLAIFIRRPAVAGFFGLCAAGAIFPYVAGRWLPSLEPHDHRALATHLRHRIHTEYRACFYGKNQSIPMMFALKQIVPQYETEEELQKAAIADPKLVVIAQTKNGIPPPPVPAALEPLFRDRLEDQAIEVYVVARKAEGPTSRAFHATTSSSRRSGASPGSSSHP